MRRNGLTCGGLGKVCGLMPKYSVTSHEYINGRMLVDEVSEFRRSGRVRNEWMFDRNEPIDESSREI